MYMMKVDKKFDIPSVTVLTAFLFVSTYAFKFGEALFFGFPIYYISLDIGEVINSSLKILLFMFLYSGIALFMVSNDKTRNLRFLKYGLFGVLVAAVLNYYDMLKGEWDYVSLITPSLLFSIFITTLYCLSNAYGKVDGAWHFFGFYSFLSGVFFILFCFVLGANYHLLPLQKLWFDKEGRFVVSQYKDGFLMKHCESGIGYFKFVEYKEGEFYQVSFRKVADVSLRCNDKQNAS